MGNTLQRRKTHSDLFVCLLDLLSSLVDAAFAQFKQQVIDSHHYQQWENMTEQWQWHLWYRESVFEEHEYDQERDAQKQQHHYRSSHGREREQLMMNQHDCARIHHRPLGGAQRAHHFPHPHPHPRTKAEPLSDRSIRGKKSNRYGPTAPENIQEPINDPRTTITATATTTTATTIATALESTSIGLGGKAIEAQEVGRKRSDGLLKKDSRGRFGFQPRVVPTLSTSDLAREDHSRYQVLDEEEQYQQNQQQQQQKHSKLPMVDHGYIRRSTTSTGPRRGQNCIRAHGNATAENSRHHSLHVDISLPIHTTFNSSSCFQSPTPPAAAAATASAFCIPLVSSWSSSFSLLPSTSYPTLPSSSPSSPLSPIDTSSSPSNSPSRSTSSSASTHADTMPGTIIQPSIPSSTHSPLSPKTKPCPHSTSSKITATAATTTATATTSTTRTFSSPSIISLSRPYEATTSVLTSSLQTVRSAGECGRLLAQRSRSSLNRFLGAVVEATSSPSGGLSGPTSQEPYRHYQNTRQPFGGWEPCDRQHEPVCTPPVPTPQPPQIMTITNTPPSPQKRPPSSRQLSARAKFFVCEEDSDDESEDEPPQSSVTPPQLVPNVPSKGEHSEYADCEVSFSDQEEDKTEERVFEKKSVVLHCALHPSQDGRLDMGRRHSLLSDMLMAEKMRSRTLESTTTGSKHPRSNGHHHVSSKSLSRCHSAANSDGESSHVGVVPTPELYPATSPCLRHTPPPTTPAFVHHHHNRHFYTHPEGNQAQDTDVGHGLHIHHPTVRPSGLTRTKKSMFKNLDELALMAPTNPLDSPTASPGRCSPLPEQGTRIQNRLHLQTQHFHSPPRRYSHVPMSLKV